MQIGNNNNNNNTHRHACVTLHSAAAARVTLIVRRNSRLKLVSYPRKQEISFITYKQQLHSHVSLTCIVKVNINDTVQGVYHKFAQDTHVKQPNYYLISTTTQLSLNYLLKISSSNIIFINKSKKNN